MPVHSWHPGIHLQYEGKSWMPTFVGMTLGAPPVGQSLRRLVLLPQYALKPYNRGFTLLFGYFHRVPDDGEYHFEVLSVVRS
jgi:hypothetical protein